MAKNRIDKNKNQGNQFGINPVQTKIENIRIACESKAPSFESKINEPRPAAVPTHEQIAERARMIWQQRGCIPGEDERNWNEAETQLRAEMHLY